VDGGRLQVIAISAETIVASDVVIVHDGIHYNGTHVM
jgi:hypothetical protein